MGYCFNKMNNKVLKFDIFKDIDKIRFNHYIMRRENISRLNNELKNGQFTLSVDIVAKDFNISRSKAHRLIKYFSEMGIIKMIVNGNSTRTYSIYEYVTYDDEIKNKMKIDLQNKINNEKYFEIENETNCQIDDSIIESSNINETTGYDCNKIKNINEENETLDEIEIKTNIEKSKKDNIKKDLKNNNIYLRIITYLNNKTSKNFKATTNKTKSLINARMKEGFAEEDFYKVIDVKYGQWIYSDMKKYLRPETLFSTKFEGYLNEIELGSVELTNDILNKDIENFTEWDIEFDY